MRNFPAPLLVLALCVSAACSGGSPEAAVSTPAAEGTVLSSDLASVPKSAVAPAGLAPAGVIAAPQEAGSYVLDTLSLSIYKVSDLLNGGWSPDGAVLAFSHCCDGDGFIDLLDLARGTSRRVATGDVRDLAWSPDGSKLAFVPMNQHQAGLGVRIVGRDGASVRAVVTHQGAGEPRWLDEDRIAYTVGIPNVDEPRFFLAQVAQIDQATELKRGDPPAQLDPRIVFGAASSDGEWVVYFDGPYRRGEGSTLAWNRRTRELRPLSPRLALAEWAPGSHDLLLLSIEPRTSLGVAEVLNLDSGSRRQLAGGFESRWAADGKTVAFLGYQCPEGPVVGPSELFSLNPGTNAPARNVSAAPLELEYEFALSPFRNAVAFVSLAQGSPPSWRLRIRDLDGGDLAAVTLGLEAHVRDRAWSAGGRYLLFTLGGGHTVCG